MDSRFSGENLEVFINDYLREDLKLLEKHINKYNDEIMEFVQLKNILETMLENKADGYKTQMAVGGNMFMEARVNEMNSILIDVGLGVYIPLIVQEALKFINFKIKVLNKECDVVREESIKKRTQIKVFLLYMADKEKKTKEELNKKEDPRNAKAEFI